MLNRHVVRKALRGLGWASAIGTARGYRWALALGMGALLVLLARPLHAAIVYSEPSGITTQPVDDPRWNSTVQWQQVNGGGTIIGSQYFISAQHLVPQVVGDTISLTTVTGGGSPVTTTTIYTTSAFTNIPNTDLAVWQITGAFPSSSIVPLYNAPGTETGHAISMLGYGYDVHGYSIITGPMNGQTLNGWHWDGGHGMNGEKNFGTNSVAGIVPDGPGGPPLLVSIFSAIVGSEAIVTPGDSGGGVFINVDGVEELAGVQYKVMQFYSAPDSGTNLNAAIYDTTNLYVDTDTGFKLATDVGVFGQYGYASEIKPYLSQIQQIMGVPEPSGVVLAALGFALLLAACRRRNR